MSFAACSMLSAIISLPASSGSVRDDAAVDVGRERDEALGREAVAHLLDLVVEPPPLLEHDHSRRPIPIRAPRGSPGPRVPLLGKLTISASRDPPDHGRPAQTTERRLAGRHGEEPGSEPQAHEHQGRDAHARRLVDDVPPLPRDPAAAARGGGVHPHRRSASSRCSATPTAAPRSAWPATSSSPRGVLGDAEDEYLTLRRSRRRARREPRPHAPPRVRAPAPGHDARRRRRGLGSRTSGSRSPRRWRSRWRGRTPRWPAPGIPHRRPAGLSESSTHCTRSPVTDAHCWIGRHEVRVGFLQVRTGSTPVRTCCCWCSMLVRHDVFSKDRHGLAGGVPT